MESSHPTPLVRLVRAAARPNEPAPALVLLHGRGADEHDLFSFSHLLDERLAVVSPRAPLPLMGGYMWYGGGGGGMGVPAHDDMRASLALLTTLLDDLPAACGVDPARVYVLGFSQGAAMTGALLLTASNRLAGAAMLSGYLPVEEGLGRPGGALHGKPVFVGHGVQDTIISVRWGRAARDALTGQGAAVTYREYPTAHGITAAELNDISAWLAPLLDAAP